MGVVVSFLVSILPPGDALYRQPLQGKPWGDKPMTNGGLPGLVAFVFSARALAMANADFNPIAEKNFRLERKSLRVLDTQ